eukprot:4914387-Amphidinium_carterae.1
MTTSEATILHGTWKNILLPCLVWKSIPRNAYSVGIYCAHLQYVTQCLFALASGADAEERLGPIREHESALRKARKGVMQAST